MRKNNIKVLLLIIIALIPAISSAQSLLSGPQKIVIDAKRNRLLVSNDGTGHIVEIDSTGYQRYFVRNANFIDGLEIVGDTIYGVGQNREVNAYSLETKERVMHITIDGNTINYLSSITSDSAGHLFISCPNLNEIYRLRISDQSYWIFANNNGLNKPNGILLEKEKNRIVVIDDCSSPSLIHAISLTDSTVSTLDSTTFRNPDGITRDKFGNYYIGGFYLSGIYQIDADFTRAPELFFTGRKIVYPTYDIRDHSLLITYYGTNTWGRVPLTSTDIRSINLPDEFSLYPVFPNPSDTDLSIGFELKKMTHVLLELYSSNGILLATLVNEKREPGKYLELWNENAGKSISTGIFYFRMTVDGMVQTQKAIIIK